MAVDNKDLVYLLDPVFQIEGVAGKPVVAGHIEVFYAGTDVKYITWQNFDGTKNPFKIPLNNDGRAVILVEPQRTYDVYIYDSFNNLVCSRLNVRPSCGGDISISGGIYDGIDPIVVNNDVNLISANHVPLGVQDPLYFVQDDEEGCIIGLSGGTVPEGTMNESAFGYQDGQITSYNGSAFSAGNSYEAGSYVDIDGNTINVTGLQPAGDYQSAGDYVSASELENLQPKGDYYSASNPSGFITGVDLTDYAKTEDLTAYQEKGDYYSASNPSGFINSDAISSMATTGFVAGVSADITALIPTDLFTKESADTLYQPIGNYQTAGNYVSSTELTAYATTSLVSSVSSTITGMIPTGDFELVAGAGIELVDDPNEHTTTINVTAQGGNPEVEQAVIDNSATWNDVTAKADSTAIPSLEGYATEDWVTAQGYLTTAYNPEFAYHDTAISSIDNSALYDTSAHARINTLAGRISTLSSEKADTSALTAYQEITGMTAYQSVEGMSDYATTAQLADKVDSSAITYKSIPGLGNTVSGISGNKLYSYTAENAAWANVAERAWNDNGGRRISATYQTITGMSAYLTTADSAEFYTTANESGFITGVPNTYLQNTDLTITAGKITEISGIPLSAGTTYTSPSGTILVRGNTLEASNSAVAIFGSEGFVSSFETKTIGPEDVPGTVAKFSWDEPSPNTMFNFDLNWNGYDDAKVIYSANTNLTGEITLPIGSSTNLITIPNATALDIWCNSYWLSIENNIASAADRIETVVGELAWNSALAKYQTTAGMTAYQEAGDYYSASNPSGFLTAHQSLEGYLQDSDLGITDNKVTAISGVELSAGGDVPEGVMVESGIEYNSQGYINGYSGSAIATIDQERQWFTHDDTLCHVSNSAQYALGINMSAISADLARMMGVDETVLLNNPYVNQTTTAFTVSEPLSNFKKIRFEGISHNSTVVMDEHLAPSGNENIYVMETYFCPNGDANPWQCRMGAYKTTDGLTYTGVSAKFIYMGFNNTTINGDTGNFPVINKIYGIGRKS